MKRVVPLLALLALAGCVSPERYDWGSYEEQLYAYYKDPQKAAAYTEELAKLVAQGDADGKIAPGLHAEYGYMLATTGRPAEAVAQFEAEKRRWPESAHLMDAMIASTTGPAGQQAAGR